MSDKWQLVQDGESMPMIKSPAGELYRVQLMHNGKWGPLPFAYVEEFLVEGANMLLEKNKRENPHHTDDA